MRYLIILVLCFGLIGCAKETKFKLNCKIRAKVVEEANNTAWELNNCDIIYDGRGWITITGALKDSHPENRWVIANIEVKRIYSWLDNKEQLIFPNGKITAYWEDYEAYKKERGW